MTSIRPLEREDIPAVAHMLAVYWRREPSAAGPELERFLTSTLLDNPWADADLPSWVAIDHDEIVGFLGSCPRPMTLDGNPLRMVCHAHLFAHPRVRRQAIGARLVKAMLDGPQDLSITDGATDQLRRIWEALGGSAVPISTLSFIRVFRPATLGADLVVGRHGGQVTRSPLRHASRGLDRLAETVGGERLVPATPDTVAAPLTPAALVEHVEEVASSARLRVAYDRAYLDWLFDELGRVERRGTLWAGGVGRGRLWAELVRSKSRVTGWYVCHLREGGFCRVLQFAAEPRHAEAVFDQLSFRARLFGAAALYGRLEPALVPSVTNGPCLVRPSDGRLLVHSRNPEISRAVRAGEALLTRMDGEWW